jgi:DNA-directed RNA polymerase beta' subunit
MCGNVGYIGDQNATPIILNGLKRLEYRGYDSAGIAVLTNSHIELRKDVGKLKNLIGLSFYLLGAEATAPLVDDIKEIGFKYATRSGLTIALSDINVPESKQSILDSVGGQVGEVERQYRRGLITEDEKYVKTVELWTKATDDVTDEVSKAMDPKGPIFIMATSGATKGGFQRCGRIYVADGSPRIAYQRVR